MVAQKYRWDFIGLSSQSKPTPATSNKVVDGSTFYESDTSKLYVFCKDTWYERKPLGGGGGGGTSYTAGNGIDITDDVISVDTETIQEKLTAGDNITISDGTISATDTTYSNFVGTDGTSAGTAGLVPAPATTDAGKVLGADGSWTTVDGGIKTLTTADYNWSSSGNPPYTAFNMYGADEGVYLVKEEMVLRLGGPTYGNQTLTFGVGGIMIKSRGYLYYANSSDHYVWEADANYLYYGVGTTAQFATIQNNLTSASDTRPLSANQGRVLNEKIEGRLKTNAGAPTTSTTGTLGQLLLDTTNAKVYQLTAIDTSVTPNTYTWSEVGGGSGPTVVQTTGTSTTDVMSQNAVTGMVYADPGTDTKVRIGSSYNVSSNNTVMIGTDTRAGSSSNGAVVIGDGSRTRDNSGGAVSIGSSSDASGSAAIAIKGQVSGRGAIAMGYGAQATAQGQFDIGSTNTSYGYNSSNYRLLTGLYDPQSAHDAATKGYVDGLATIGTLSSTPTGTTAGTPGRLYSYDSGGGTYEIWLCVHDNGDNTYVWKQLSLI